ncbi:hypothetical protein SNE40_004916 [Patella caerulea]|uniref:Phorbol-ester/DAG-type domain-containing protein n=1 Tax=Patella caerulea TaxID=87958 RepID=A0AAN8QD18_PATCE
MATCIFCSATVRPRQEGIQCQLCGLWQHRTCKTGISQATYRRAVKGLEEITWKCVPCLNAYPAVAEVFLSDDDMESHETSTGFDVVLEDLYEAITPITIPEPRLEDSVKENTPVFDVTPEDGPRYTVVSEASKRGQPKLLDKEGYSYTFKKQSTNGNKHWRCSYRQKHLYCPATVIETADIFRQGSKGHIHPAEPGIHITINITAEVRKNADKDMLTTSAPCYVKQVYRKLGSDTVPHHSRPKLANLVRAVNRQRQNSRLQTKDGHVFIN